MAASILNRLCVTRRVPTILRVAPERGSQYSTALTVTRSTGPGFQENRGKQKVLSQRGPPTPRTEKMPPEQDWSNVYPTAAAFKPSAVPLPVRMGYPLKASVPPEKTGNLELVKIPNFLHLTPVAIKQHCDALREFCTEWPSVLSTEDICTKHFPIEFQTIDYVSSGPSVRNPKARVVTMQVKLSNLNLDDHAKKKLVKLVGSRYDKATDTLTIRTDRCPLRRQNQDHAMYLLTVLYHESWKTEVWESEKAESDMEEYVWEGSRSEANVLQTLLKVDGDNLTKDDVLHSPKVQEYRSAVLKLRNQGENEDNVKCYKESVKKMLGLA